MDEHSKISRNAAVGVHGYLLVYAATSRASFERVKALDDLLVEMHGGSLSVPRVVVATCIDLADQRQVHS
jgi:Ras family protein